MKAHVMTRQAVSAPSWMGGRCRSRCKFIGFPQPSAGVCVAALLAAVTALFVACPARALLAAETAARSSLGATSEDGQQWPLFRGDRQATGVARCELPEKPELLWTYSGQKGGYEAAAVIGDGTVYIGSVDGKFSAIDLASGQARWEFSTDAGFNSAAALVKGRVLVGDTNGRFHCLDARTGKEQWHFDSEGEINSGANLHGQHVLFGSQDSFLYCLDVDTGKLIWKYESPNQIRCFPTIVENRTLVAGCDGRLHVIDLAEGKEVASVDLEGPTGSTPAALGSLLFVGSEGKTFFGIDWQKATVAWRYTAEERAASFRSSAAVTSELVVVGSQDRLVHALDPKTGARLWTFATRGRVDGSPVIVGDRVFVGSADGRIYALDAKTGRERWRFEAGGAVVASPAVAAGRLVIGTDAGDLYCFGRK